MISICWLRPATRIQRLQLELEDLDLELTGVMEPLTEELKGKKGTVLSRVKLFKV